MKHAIIATIAGSGPAAWLCAGIFVEVAGDTEDRVIEHDREHGCFQFGVLIWQPCELDTEIKRGAWYVNIFAGPDR